MSVELVGDRNSGSRFVWDCAAAEGRLMGRGRPRSLTARPQESRALVVHPPGTMVPGQSKAGGGRFRGYRPWNLFSLLMANGKNGCLTGAAVAYGLSRGRTGAPAKLLNLCFGRARCKTGINH